MRDVFPGAVPRERPNEHFHFWRRGTDHWTCRAELNGAVKGGFAAGAWKDASP